MNEVPESVEPEVPVVDPSMPEEGNDQEVAVGTEVPEVEEADLEDASDNGEEEDAA
jgi:hypothetical protein